jgi:hypothetical protein
VIVAEYFARIGRPLRSAVDFLQFILGLHFSFPSLPLLVDRQGSGERVYPMEMCTVLPYQRVTIVQQTPAQMERMIKVGVEFLNLFICGRA